MNKSKKGYLFEKHCRDLLKADGWIIAFKSQRIKFNKIDFFSLFDIVALRRHITPIEIEKERLYISCKVMDNSHGWLKNHKLAIEYFKQNYGLECERFEIWIKKNKEIEKVII